MDKLNCMVDLHLHLDGAISVESAKDLAALQGIAIPESEKELVKMLRVSEDCRNLNEFLEKFDFPCSLLQTHEGVRMATSNLLNELKAQGVMYAELRFAPQLCTNQGMTQDEVVQAAIEGLNDVDGIIAQLILCCMRGEGNDEANFENIDVAARYLGKGVCAADLAGAEALFTTDKYADLFAYAREKGVPFTLHAGEADGPESVREAIGYGASRIGHGVRSIEDPELVKLLAEKKIPLEICPNSNVCTVTYPNIEAVPVRQLMEAGVIITINTDDPSVVGTDINKELNDSIKAFNLTKDEVKQLLINSVNSAFADEVTKVKLLEKIDKELKII